MPGVWASAFIRGAAKPTAVANPRAYLLRETIIFLQQSYCTETVTFVSEVMSTLSPTLTLSSTAGSTTRRLYFHPFGPVKVIDCALLSMALIVAVIVFSTAAVPPGLSPCPAVVVPVAVLTGASPGGFNLAETVLLYVIETLSPTLSSSNRFAPGGTSIVSNLPSGVLMFTTRFSLSMVSTVPESARVCVGSVRVCAQLGSERAITSNPDALRIVFSRFMQSSFYCRIGLFGAYRGFLTSASLTHRFLGRLCKNWKNSRRGEARFRSALESGRRGLARYRPIPPGEASQLREPEKVGN